MATKDSDKRFVEALVLSAYEQAVERTAQKHEATLERYARGENVPVADVQQMLQSCIKDIEWANGIFERAQKYIADDEKSGR